MIIDIQRYWGEREIFYPGELSSAIICGMQANGQVILRSKEARVLRVSGLYDLLDQLCAFWKWDKQRILIETGNLCDIMNPGDYPLKFVHRVESAINFSDHSIIHHEWTKEKAFGMFIGRANVTRLRAIRNFQEFEFKDAGLTSFNQDVTFHVDQPVLVDYLRQTDDKFSNLAKIRPYSDISQPILPPITCQYADAMWNNVYKRIGLEIILETTEDNFSSVITEKFIRPIMYKRPFLLVASKNIITNVLKNINDLLEQHGYEAPTVRLKFFENVIPLDYDSTSGICRVDYVFDILRYLIESKKIYSILETCRDDIENNYNFFKQAIEIQRRSKDEYMSAFDFLSWDKPTYK